MPTNMKVMYSLNKHINKDSRKFNDFVAQNITLKLVIPIIKNKALINFKHTL